MEVSWRRRLCGCIDLSRATQSTLRESGHAVVVGLFGGRSVVPIPPLLLQSMSLQGSDVGSLEEARALLELVQEDVSFSYLNRKTPTLSREPHA